MWIGCIWFQIGTSGRLMWTWQWTFRFYKKQGISWLGEWLLASEGRLCSLVHFTGVTLVFCVTMHFTSPQLYRKINTVYKLLDCMGLSMFIKR
jgi:hypothetical protein